MKKKGGRAAHIRADACFIIKYKKGRAQGRKHGLRE